MQGETNHLPRRACQWLRTSTETKIIDVMHEVEALGASEDLTEAIIALEKAFNRVANHTDASIKQLGHL